MEISEEAGAVSTSSYRWPLSPVICTPSGLVIDAPRVFVPALEKGSRRPSCVENSGK